MRIVKSSPHEYLVVGRRGAVVNKGTAASAFLWPGSTYVVIPSTKQEARFEMTQESKDGVPLRFKGLVIYRIVDPLAAARLFDFTGARGHEEIQVLISHVCLGELRAVVSQMMMSECIEQRKTTLSMAVARALERVVKGGGEEQQAAWGIELDVVQVAQVYIVDDQLRRQLESGVRNEIKARSELSEIQTREEIRLAQIASERRMQQEALESERATMAVNAEKLRLQQEYERAAQREALESERATMAVNAEKLRLQQEYERQRIETDAPVRQLELARRQELLEREREVRRRENEVVELQVAGEMLQERARQELRLELLPLEQAPQIARSLAQVFQGANLSIYGDGAGLLGLVAPLVELLGRHLAPQVAGAAPAPQSPGPAKPAREA